MLYEDLNALRVEQQGRAVILSAGGIPLFIFRAVVGCSLMTVGSCVVYGLSTGQFRPVGVFGWIVFLAFFMALGVFPLWWGLSVALMQERYIVDPDRRELRCWRGLCGLPVLKKSHPFSSCADVGLHRERRGTFGGRWLWIVSVRKKGSFIELVAFSDEAKARHLAQRIGDGSGLHVTVDI